MTRTIKPPQAKTFLGYHDPHSPKIKRIIKREEEHGRKVYIAEYQNGKYRLESRQMYSFERADGTLVQKY